ncbi:Protein zwilch-like protein [Trichoplax sp. H2]|nr:Protein zwilch-like protein [Trichoplax sp. H2]|eukprot:RDD39794.1 Protein zwilch-like protein [Trichoplax sp. H2]
MERLQSDSENFLQFLISLKAEDLRHESRNSFQIFPTQFKEICNVYMIPEGVNHPKVNLASGKSGFYLVTGYSRTALIQDEVSSVNDQNQFNNSYESTSFEEEDGEEYPVSLTLTAERFVRIGPANDALGQMINIFETFHSDNLHEVVSWNIAADSMIPLPYASARQLLSYFALSHTSPVRNGQTIAKPCWILTTKNGASIYLGIVTSVQDSFTKLSTWTVSTEEKLYKRSDVPKLENRLTARGMTAESKMKAQGYAQYRLLSPISEDSKLKSSLTLELVWQGLNTLIEKPALMSDAILTIKGFPGDPRSPINWAYKEFEILEKYWMYSNKDVEIWPTHCGYKVDVMSSVKSFLQDPSKPIQISSNDEFLDKSDSCLDSSISSYIICPRSDFDFVDKIWIILKYCNNLNELTEAVSYIAQKLADGRLLPQLDPLHQNSLATAIGRLLEITLTNLSGLIKDKNETNFKFNWPGDKRPIDCLVEIGLDKLRKDYLNYIADISTVRMMQQLDDYLQYGGNMEDKLQYLKKMHSILDMLAIVKTQLNPSGSIIEKLLKAALQYYKDSHQLMAFALSLPAFCDGKSIVPADEPYIWTMSASNEMPNFNVSAIAHSFNVHEGTDHQDNTSNSELSTSYLISSSECDEFSL